MAEFKVVAAYGVGWVVIADGADRGDPNGADDGDYDLYGWSNIYAAGPVVLGSWRNTLAEAREVCGRLRWLRTPSGMALPAGLQAAQLAAPPEMLTAWGNQAAEAGRHWVHTPTPVGRIRPTDRQASVMWADQWAESVTVAAAWGDLHTAIAEMFLMGVKQMEMQDG